MWKDNRRRSVIANIIITILILGILAGLGYVMLMVRAQTRAHDEELSQIYVQQQQQQTEARQESVTAIQEEYDRDMAAVQEYLPGIVCWGDSLTLGSSGNISYPSVLQAYLDTYFCDIYDFRSSIENADEYARLRWDDYKVSIPVVNMGAGSESTYTVMGRAGVVPYVLSEDITIPEARAAVEIKIESAGGREVTPLKGGSAGVNDVVIDGIPGTISIYAGDHGVFKYYFTRSEAGKEVEIPAYTEIRTAGTDMYRDYIHVVCIGSYGWFSSPSDLVNQVKTLLSRQTQNPERFIVLGICSVSATNAAPGYLDAVDTAMMQAFGNRYINVRKYLMEDGLSDAGITPTLEDKRSINNGHVPDSFTSARSGVELNGKAYTLIGKLVYDRMNSLGYFNEVFEELNITETTRRILKDDPGYFERILSSRLN